MSDEYVMKKDMKRHEATSLSAAEAGHQKMTDFLFSFVIAGGAALY